MATKAPAKPAPTKKKTAPKVKKPLGRPSSFTQKTADTICLRLSDGESLRTICQSSNMPDRNTVFQWLAKHPDFQGQYARARDAQADYYAESTVDIADEEVTMIKRSKHGSKDDDGLEGDIEVVFDPTAVARNRLRIDARKWYASKLAPKKYGDKVDVNHGGQAENPVTVLMAQLAGKTLKPVEE